MESINVLAVCHYAVDTNYHFHNSFEELEEAYGKHICREDQKETDPLIQNAVLFRKRLLWKKKLSLKPIYKYDFMEVKNFLRRKHLWGMECYDCHSTDSTECIYSKNGVTICTCYQYGYIDVVGLTPEDFKKVKSAYYSRRAQLLEI